MVFSAGKLTEKKMLIIFSITFMAGKIFEVPLSLIL